MALRVLLIVGFLAVLVVTSVLFGLLLQAPARLDLSPAGWIEWQQEAIPLMRVMIGVAFLVSLVSTIAAGVLLHRHGAPASRWLFIVAGLLLVALLITLIGELPLNDDIEGWSAQRPPSDWEDVRNEWETLHAIRAVAVAAGLAILYFAVPLPKRDARP